MDPARAAAYSDKPGQREQISPFVRTKTPQPKTSITTTSALAAPAIYPRWSGWQPTT